jgi:transcription elongation factor GreA
MQPTPMTAHGHKKLVEELHHLKTKERPAIVEAIKEARAHGDLKENAEYHAAKEKQSFNEGRIQELEAKLSHCQVIELSQIPNNGKVIFGSTVTLYDVDHENKVTYQIVGEDESDIKHGKLSINSPIARALIAKSLDDEVTVDVPGGKKTFEIVSVEYLD